MLGIQSQYRPLALDRSVPRRQSRGSDAFRSRFPGPTTHEYADLAAWRGKGSSVARAIKVGQPYWACNGPYRTGRRIRDRIRPSKTCHPIHPHFPRCLARHQVRRVGTASPTRPYLERNSTISPGLVCRVRFPYAYPARGHHHQRAFFHHSRSRDLV